MRKISIGTVVFLLIISIFISCRKEDRNPFWDVDLLFPVVKSTLTINNIISDTLLIKNPDNSLDLFYKYSLSSFSIDSLFSIPDTTIHSIYPAPFTYTVSPGGVIIPLFSNSIYYPLGDAKLSRVTLRSGKMQLTIKSQIKGLVDFTYTLPKVTDKYGNIFDTTFTVPAATQSNGGLFVGVFDLSGYNIDLSGINGFSVNTMVTSYSAILSPTNQGSVTITAAEDVDVANTFLDIVPQYAKGYFGQTVNSVGPDSSFFTMFKNIIGGNINFEDIDIGLHIQNSIGADSRITINQLSSINSQTGNTIPLSHSVIGTPININRSLDNGGIVIPSTYSVSFNPTNSNIKQFVENLPNQLSYQLDLAINPLGNVSGGNDFVYYDKLMKTDLNMTIPLSLIANNLTMADTLKFKMPTNSNNVNSGFLYLIVDNGFPFTAETQLYLMDANYVVFDSLISLPNIIAAPLLDGNFISAGKKTTKLTFPIDAEKLVHLRNSPNIFIKLKFNTQNQPNYVKIYSFYELNIKLIADFNYTVGKK